MSVEERSFQTEVSQLLDIVINSLYSNKEIFLRELISNASDAIDKAKYEGLTDPAIYEGGTDWKIRIIPDKEADTLTVSDNGIGMSHDETVKLLGTIAHSGTKEFMKQMAEKDSSADTAQLIGQFGVGFYSAYMVADKVTVITRKRGQSPEEGVRWISDGKNSYTIENYTKETPGTDIILNLQEDHKNTLQEWSLKRIITTYSDYIEYPIVMNVEKAKTDSEGKATDEKEIVEETVNSRKAIWLKDRSEVTAEEQNQFYKHIGHDFSDPLKTVQFKAEGTLEFSAILFIPARAPFNLFNVEIEYGPMLYVKRVQIMEHCSELVPRYLRFLQGVVESSDLPLNISREILQNNRQTPLIQKNIVRRVLDTLAEMLRDEPDNYKKFYAEFGKVLKEGIHTDYERRETIVKLALFESTATKPGETTTLDDYISRMKSDQKDIYYITGSTRRELENSPYLETLKEKDLEVLFMIDEVDDIIFESLGMYAEKQFKSVLKGDLDLDADVTARKAKSYEDFVGKVKNALGDKVEAVRLTNRLKSSPAVLVVSDGSLNPQMERMFKAMGQSVPSSKRTLEINPDHILIKSMKKELGEEQDPKKFAEYVQLIYDQALLLEGEKIDDPSGFVKKISAIMAKILS